LRLQRPQPKQRSPWDSPNRIYGSVVGAESKP